MTPEEVAVISIRAGAATEGPWKARGYRVYAPGDNDPFIATCWREWGRIDSIEADAEFIAVARTAVPELVDEVRRLRYAMTLILEFGDNADHAIDIANEALGNVVDGPWLGQENVER